MNHLQETAVWNLWHDQPVVFLDSRIRTYNLDGAVVGSHKVSIVALDKGSGMVDPKTGIALTMYDPRWKPAASLIPPKYGDHERSKLTAKVESGVKNQFSFDLDDE